MLIILIMDTIELFHHVNIYMEWKNWIEYRYRLNGYGRIWNHLRE